MILKSNVTVTLRSHALYFGSDPGDSVSVPSGREVVLLGQLGKLQAGIRQDLYPDSDQNLQVSSACGRRERLSWSEQGL